MRRLLTGFAITAAAASAAAEEPEPAKALAAAVDLPTPQARAQAAARLAAREDVTLEAWLAATRAFGEFARRPPGAAQESVKLAVGDAVAPTTIATYVPQGYDPARPAPLLLAFHPAGSDGPEEAERWSEVAEKLGMLVVAPTDPGAGAGYRFSEAERLSALAVLRWARRTFDVDENRVFVAGASRGGHLAWDLALRHADRLAAAAFLVGAPRLDITNGQNNLRYLENLAPVPVRDLQGLKDDPRAVENARRALSRLERLGARDAKFVEFPERGHDFDFAAVDWAAFLGGAERDPVPPRVVRLCARLDEARTLWAEVTQVFAPVEERFVPKLEAKKWEAMGDSDKRAFLQEEADARTARLEVRMTAPGRFEAQGTRVARFRLLLAQGMFERGAPVQVVYREKTISKDARPSKLVLLRDFVERFDRTFLPVAEVSLP